MRPVFSQTTLALAFLLLCRINAGNGQSIYPEAQSAAPGDIVLFECISENYTLVWRIDNGRDLSRNNLPVGHWINSSGLVVQARPELNGVTYHCVPITITLSGTSLLATQDSNSNPVSLMVTSSGGTTVDTNYRKGIVVTSVVYDQASDSLMIEWEPESSSSNYQLYISSCTHSFWLQSLPRRDCTPVLIDGIMRALGNNSVTIDVRTCDEDGECEFSPPQGAMVDQQTLVKLEMNNSDLVPRELPALTLASNNMRIFQSKLWSQCTRAGLSIAVFTATTRVNYTVTEIASDFAGSLFLRVTFAAPSIEIRTSSSNTLNKIRTKFGQSVREIYIQEYCTDTTSCDGRLTTTFGDKIKLIVDPAQSSQVVSFCTYTVEDILRSPTPTIVEMIQTSTPAVVRSMTSALFPTVRPTTGPVIPTTFSLGAIIGLALAIVLLIALVLGVPIVIIGIFSWNKRRKSGNALAAGNKLYDQPMRSSFRRSLPGTPKLSPSRQSVCDSPISPTYSTYIGRPLVNGDSKNPQYQLVALVEGPQTAMHSPQGSISFGGHSRNPSGVAPMDRYRQFSDSPTAEPQTPDFITQMKIPDLNLTEPVRRYVPVDLLPAAFSDSLASTPVPMHDQDGHQLPPRPGAPPPLSIPPPPILQMAYDRERPNSAQQMNQAPPYFNPPSYPNQQWSATLPRSGRPPQSDLATINNTAATHSDEDRIWNVV